jgi:photosystem II stability/assembly factor-like uncharacterized protein
VLYLASNVNAMGVWRSDDAGVTWHRVFYDGNFGATHTNTVAIHPTNPQIVLISDLHGRIVKTSDGGDRWTKEQEMYEAGSPVFALAFSPSQPDIVYAGDAKGNLIKSIDMGSTWEVLSQVVIGEGKQGGIGSLAVDPDNPDTVYVGARSGVYKSTDGGRSWRKVLPEVGQRLEVVEVTVASSEPGLLLAATPEGVFQSTNGGESWRRSLDRHAHSVQVAAANPQVVYAGTKEGVYRSDDGGVTWIRYSGGIQYLDIGPLTVHPEDSDVVLAGSNIWEWTFHYDDFPSSTLGEGIYKTVDGGVSWSKVNQGFIDVDVVALAVDPNDPNVAYVGMECSRGIFRTDDGGASWVFIAGGPEKNSDIAHYTMRLAIDPNSTIYLTGRFGVARSDDRGQNWIPMLVRRHFHGVGINPHDPRLVFVGTSPKQDPTETNGFPGGRILRSADGGLSWQEVGSGFPSGADTSIHGFAFDATDPNIVYVVTSSHEIGLPRTSTAVGIYKSTDGGQTWTAANNGLSTMEVDAIVVSPTMSGLLYAGTEKGVFRSSNGGDNWVPTELTESVRSLVIDPTDSDSVFAGTEVGLFWSSDGGTSWQRIDSVPPKPVTSLAMDPQGRVLYAAVNDVGIFKGVRE